MTAIEALQRYFAYASHQLSRSGGQNVVAAEALYCLGKLALCAGQQRLQRIKIGLGEINGLTTKQRLRLILLTIVL